MPANFCNNPNLRGEKIANKNLINNWVSEFDLICANKFIFVAFYMVIFSGFVCGGLFVAPISDSVGRKKVFLISLVGMFVLNWMLLY